ncbi:DUF805 domain-containing protein [Nocardioides aestuarii]|uniref:DUF805 domain-containing protein n=1 Tax=Nocardioides aestuarii TaxID=252231 RepID=A0ABW4TK14_9ACTN
MGFTTAVRTCLLEKYATLEGRARRSEYWWFQLFLALVALVAVLLVFLFRSEVPLYVMAVVGLGLVLPSIGVTVRRLHDTSRSGWWYLISFVPYVGPIVLLVFCCLDSAPSNQYGTSPKVEPNVAGYLQPGT